MIDPINCFVPFIPFADVTFVTSITSSVKYFSLGQIPLCEGIFSMILRKYDFSLGAQAE